jgi:phospholipid N-methyltransferase
MLFILSQKWQKSVKPEVAKKCVEALSNIIKFEKYNTIIEPSAGSGVFSDMFLEFKDLNTLSYDIEPKQDYIKKQDFLKLNTNFLEKNKVLTIGNPPFGRQSSLAKKFIKKVYKKMFYFF